MNDEVTIPRVEYERLLELERWLDCLEVAGVYNWEGYSDAIREFYDN